MPNIDRDEITKVAKDTLYVGVGLGVIAFQKAQVQRQELTKQLKGQADEARDQFGSVGAYVEDQVKGLEGRLTAVESQVESVLDQLQEKLPEQAADLVKQARDAAKDARDQVNHLVARNGAAA